MRRRRSRRGKRRRRTLDTNTGKGMQEGGRGIGRRDVIKRRIVICFGSNSAIIISVAAAEAAASARFLMKFTRAQRRPSSSIHAFHVES